MTGELASAPNRSGRMRHFGTSVTPFWCPNGRWHGNARPTSQSSSTGSCEPTTSCSVRSCGIRGGVTRDPVLRRRGPRRRRRAAPGWRRDGIAAIGTRRLRQAGAGADVAEADAAAGRHGACRRWPIARRPRPGRTVRPRRPPAAGPPGRGGGSRYHAERSGAGCWVPDAPAAHHGRGGGIEVVRQPGPRPVDARRGRGAALGARLAAGRRTGRRCRRSCDVPWGSMTGSADTSAGIPLGLKPSAVRRRAPRRPERRPGSACPALGSCSTITSLASPHVLPVSASRLDRPTVHAGYCSDHREGQRQHLEDDQRPDGNRQRRLHDPLPAARLLGGDCVAAGEVEPRRHQQGQDRQAEQEWW